MNWSELVENAPDLVIRYGINFILAIAIFLIGKWLAQKAIAWISRIIQERGVDPVSYTHLTLPTICSV